MGAVLQSFVKTQLPMKMAFFDSHTTRRGKWIILKDENDLGKRELSRSG